MENKKQYVVVGIWYGIEDEEYREWYSGILHDNRSDARRELIDALSDRNYEHYVIEEV